MIKHCPLCDYFDSGSFLFEVIRVFFTFSVVLFIVTEDKQSPALSHAGDHLYTSFLTTNLLKNAKINVIELFIFNFQESYRHTNEPCNKYK